MLARLASVTGFQNMSPKGKQIQFLICDDNMHTRRMVADVLAGAGFEKVQFATGGAELLKLTIEFLPRIVITSSRVPELSGLEYTRLIRGGYGTVNRALSVIVMTDTPTQKFLDASRAAGVDEMLVRQCVTRISELSVGLTPGDRRKLREIYAAVRDAEQLADDVRDQSMGDAARSLARYIMAIGGAGVIDPEVVTTHIDAMQKLGYMTGAHMTEREMLVQGLVAVVDKRLGRKETVQRTAAA